MSIHDIGYSDMNRINRMDSSAFRLLYSVFYKVLVEFACKYVADISAAEDIVQEVFATLWEHKRNFLTPESVKAFFYSSVHNASLNWLKHQNVVNGYAQQTSLDHGRASIPVGDEIFDEEVYRQLFAAIDALPSRQREVFLLQMEGKSNAEIAEKLNIAIETVKTHKKRGMAYLHKHVSTECILLLMTLTATC